MWKHASAALSCEMRFAVFTPPAAVHGAGPYPTLFWLSGLTCTEDNFTVKAGAQRMAAELGLMIIAPDTSPRGDDVPDMEPKTYDFGKGAGFYLDARKTPGLESSALVESNYTIQSLSEGNIVLALPRTGYSNVIGQTMYELSQGDLIEVSMDIPYNSTADVRFGSDNVVLKYLGIVGTEYTMAD